MSRRTVLRLAVPVVALLSLMVALPQTATAAQPANAASALLDSSTRAASAPADKSTSVLRLYRKAETSADVGPAVINCYLTVNTPRKEGTTLPRQVRVYAQVSCDLPIDEVQIAVVMYFGGFPLEETLMGVARPDTNFAFGDTVPTNCGVLGAFQGEAYAIVFNDGYVDDGGAFGPPITFTNCI